MLQTRAILCSLHKWRITLRSICHFKHQKWLKIANELRTIKEYQLIGTMLIFVAFGNITLHYITCMCVCLIHGNGMRCEFIVSLVERSPNSGGDGAFDVFTKNQINVKTFNQFVNE